MKAIIRNTKKEILDILATAGRRGDGLSTSVLTDKLKISRQAVARHLRELVDAGKVTKTGSTKTAKYALAKFSKNKNSVSQPTTEINKIYQLKSLQEHLVFEEFDLKLNLKKHLNENVHSIAHYAFTEMLNNSIDHSKAKTVTVCCGVRQRKFFFEIKDGGIGAFFNVMKTFKLNSEFEGLEHLLKGKQTTMPERHSGQGVFFTSRIADRFDLKSHKLQLVIDNEKEDVFVSDLKHNIQGTCVYFEIASHSKKTLKPLFDKYSDADYDFDRSDYKVKITADREWLSRSQAKRILFGLDKYNKLIFDFKDVQMIGQAFADEIFRVYQNTHPDMEITFINAGEAVTGMILRAIRGNASFSK